MNVGHWWVALGGSWGGRRRSWYWPILGGLETVHLSPQVPASLFTKWYHTCPAEWDESQIHTYILCYMLSPFSHVHLIVTPWTVAHKAPLFMGFSKQECWTGLPCPPPGDLRDPGFEPVFLTSPALPGWGLLYH